MTWVPIKSGSAVHYFQPELGTVTADLPAGARAAPSVSLVAADHSQPSSVDAVAVGSVEASEKKSCYPQCTWNCTKPVCNQDCSPECEQPKCQTRCPKPDYSNCNIDCGTPKCTVFCPKDPCQQTPGSTCSSPKCSTQCARPSCDLKCKDHVPCQSLCHPPRCTWSCRNPKACPKPECRLVCERPLGCAQTYNLPPLSPAMTVQKSFNADRAKWVTYPWSKCGVQCGKSFQTRKVLCSTGEDHECQFSPKPPTQQACEDLTGCNAWQTSEWSMCSVKCGKGHMTRKVWCSNKDHRECLEEKPVDKKKCKDHGAHCTECKVSLYGGAYFTGWHTTFAPGSFDTKDMIGAGAKCQEVSSAVVQGRCCHAQLYQYGDFNKKHNGWTATLQHGRYDVEALAVKGVQDNDVSALKVWVDKTCSTEGHKYKAGGDEEGDARLRRVPGEGGSQGGAGRSRSGSSKGDSSSASAEKDELEDDVDNDAEDDADTEEEQGDSIAKSLSESKEGGEATSHGYPWWFWLLMGLLVIAVVTAVVLACRRQGQQGEATSHGYP
eukprot:CAMPEP_0204265874 /NCGR_PEP_ID=MMETSP0468-20130131/9959_1 /ASSEMBLY_ACC=CAM_ASM_000383 /TAXON_ID=2969 /ORGANISM="Oxyrrhis marina" /LENGTH=548 /DNA_ID=CAMNT_0051240873 /DNA_START=200 /DNA_END=1842 /DNA_ORIENTATION=-